MTLGWHTVLAVDHCPRACQVYRANVPAGRVECAEVRDLLGSMPKADVILGGPPCQPYSSAGKRMGDADERDCVPDFCAAVEEVRPRMFLMEEVAAFASDQTFAPVLHRTVGRLERAGYDVQMGVLDAVDFGVPQFRKRAWFWGIRRDLGDVIARRKWPVPTHADPATLATPSMFWPTLEPWVTTGQALGLGAASIIGGGSNPRFPGDARTERDITNEPSTTIPAAHTHNAVPAVHDYRWSDEMLQKHPPASPASPASTVQAKWSKGGAEGLVSMAMNRPSQTLAWGSDRSHVNGRSVVREPTRSAVRRLTPDECARLQSMPDDFVWPGSVRKTHRYRIVGNGWASLMALHLSRAFRWADPDSRTVIDLFCGGGCGAVGWHGRAWEARA